MGVTIQIFKSDIELFQSLSEGFFSEAAKCIDSYGSFYVALSGGTSPIPFFELLAANSGRLKLWNKVHFFWVDERWVPHDHQDSNYGAAYRAGLSRLPASFNPVDTSLSDANQACYEYEKKIIAHQRPNGLCFDWMLLGAGDDAHTASIFQKDLNAVQDQQLVYTTNHPQSGQLRISLTLSGLMKSKEIVVLMAGEKKRALLGTLNQGNGPIHKILKMHPSIKVISDIH